MSLNRSYTVGILKKMSKQEMVELGDYVDSRFSKATPLLKKAWAFLESCYPHFDKDTCNKKLFSEKVLDGKADKKAEREINRLMSELRVLAEKYIIMTTAMADKANARRYLKRWYIYHAGEKHTDKAFRETEQMLLHDENVERIELYWYYLDLKGDHFACKWDLQQYLLVTQDHAVFLNEFSRYLSLCNELNVVNVKEMASRALPSGNRGKIKRKYLRLSFKQEVQFYEKLLEFLKNPTRTGYQYIKTAIGDKRLKIEKRDKIRALQIMNNNVDKLFSGRRYLHEGLAIIELKQAYELEFYDGFIEGDTYGARIRYLCTLGDTAAARSFYDSAPKIIGKQIVNSRSLYLAFLLLAENKFDEALEIVSRCKPVSALSKMNVGILKVMLAYMMQNRQLLEAHVNSFRKFVSSKAKNIIKERRIKNNLALATYILSLSRLSPSAKEALLRLKKTAENDKAFYDNVWLIEQIDRKLAMSHKDKARPPMVVSEFT